MSAISVLIGTVIGAVGAWFWCRRLQQQQLVNERERRSSAESTVAALREQLSAIQSELQSVRSDLRGESTQRAAAEARLAESQAAEQRLTNTFKALSDDALKSNNRSFLQLAQEALKTVLAEAKGDLGQRQEAIKSLVQPLQDSLKRFEEQAASLEQKREQAYGELHNQLTSMAAAEAELQEQARGLVSALRQPQVRGRWGELTLRRVVELAGMSEHCDFTEQASVNAEERRLQPDLVIRLPAGREIVVDAKTPLDGYLDATEETDNFRRDEMLARHATQMRAHMVHLASKAYWGQFASPEFVIMFIPGESFLSAAVHIDRTLVEDAMSNKVVLATPTTVVALLKAVAYGWRHEQLARNAQEVAQLGRDIYTRFLTLRGHLDTLRRNLQGSVTSFNTMLGSLEHSVLPGLRKFQELGAGEGDIASIGPIEQTPRQPMLPQESEAPSHAEAFTPETER